MSLLRRCWGLTKRTMKTYEDRFDQWLLRNPLALLSHIRFRMGERTRYSPRARRVSLVVKMFGAGYLLFNLAEIDLNEYYWSDPPRVMTQYETLANLAEHDHLDQSGKEPHLLDLFARGKQRGLSQIELFELSKQLQLNYTAKNVVYHVEYLRNLKS